MSNCCDFVEPCHTKDCDGFDEVVKLLPKGQIWSPDRGGVYGAYIQALGHIKTELNQIICQEYNELNPCTSVRLFDYYAKLYKFPPCVEQTQERLCEWLDLINGPCPIGSQGFLRRAIEFVLQDDNFEIHFNLDQTAQTWQTDKICAEDNAIVITAPAKYFRYYEYDGDFVHELQDGVNCRHYFIPEVECLRPCIFPIGLSVGYKTLEPGKYNINNPPESDPLPRPEHTLICNTKTGENDDYIC